MIGLFIQDQSGMRASRRKSDMWFLHFYLTVNAIAFVFIYCKIMFSSGCSMFIYPELVEWFQNSRDLSHGDAIIYAVLTTIVFAPAILLWYLFVFIPVLLCLFALLIIRPFVKPKKWWKK